MKLTPQQIKELINNLDKRIQEISTSANAGSYQTPNAFTGSSKPRKPKTMKDYTEAKPKKVYLPDGGENPLGETVLRRLIVKELKNILDKK